jgi:hypothetical protein
MTPRITLLTQPDCALCDHAKTVLTRIRQDTPLDVEEIPLDTDPGRALALTAGVLFAPGVLLNGAPFGYGRLSERRLRTALHTPSDQPTQPPAPAGDATS